MKRFLYKPVLNAIDAREKRIASALADADTKKAEAQKERDEFHQKNDEFKQKPRRHSLAKQRARPKSNVSDSSTKRGKRPTP